MRILFLSQVLPYPLDAGPKMRSYYVLRHLVQKHEVTLLTFVRDTDRPEDMAHLAQFCYAVHTVPMQRSRLRDVKFLLQSFLTGQPFLITRDHVPAMAAKLSELITSESYDAVHADQLWMAQYALAARTGSSRIKLILDQHNAVHLIPQRLANGEAHPVKRQFLAREARRLMSYEADVCRRFDHVVWVTEEDRQAVSALPTVTKNGHPSSSVIPICVAPTQIQPVVSDANRPRITFLGGLHWPPNAQGIVWFANQIFPQVLAELPAARLTVIGKSPPAELAGAGVEVTGYVADLMPYLTETTVFIVPLQAGGGMRVKILDAWSWGLPVVSTSIGAEGIEARHEDNILIADNAQAFAQAIIRLFAEPTLAHHLAQNGRRTVIEKYNWQDSYSAWNEIYPGLIEHSDYV
jgi:glycosyltransferase involved in cell wall biosynthesis